jgi:hypothetical protein
MFFMVLGAGDIESARNIFHYLAFWSFDIAGLQETLAFLGLSSLESCEAHTIATVNFSPPIITAASSNCSSRWFYLSWLQEYKTKLSVGG